ncbi:glycosyltransferase family 2 protein [Pelagibacterales bacterium SAG-MED07]|nr:glycosyltransferase family 2 protein [Pelagibacterales bacterium SAG-MED07]
MKASIVIANYNNEKFINDCINSLNSQTYKNIEIIFFDDNSNDNSIGEIEKFSNIKIIKNNIQKNFGSLNQINAFEKAIDLSTGEIIFFLDSDDFFHEKKVEKIMNFFLNNNNKMIVFDFPIILKKNLKVKQKKTNNFFRTYWGYIHPTSCITIRKKFVNEVFNSIHNENFTNIWLDLRILLFSKYIHTYDIINENLTYYRQTDESVSSKFKKFSLSWWNRRGEAHDYFFDFMRKNNLESKKNLDYYVTKVINRFIK